MCQSMVNIQSPTAEIRRGKKKKEERRTNHSMKIYVVSLFHRATIKYHGILGQYMYMDYYGTVIFTMVPFYHGGVRLLPQNTSTLPLIQSLLALNSIPQRVPPSTMLLFQYLSTLTRCIFFSFSH